MSVLLLDLFLPAFEGSDNTSFSNEALELREAEMPRLASTVLRPITTPGLHFHHVPRLATIEGIIIGTDAGAPRFKERAEARVVDHIGNEGLVMSANGT